MDVKRRTTKANLTLVIGIVVFLVAAGVMARALAIHPSEGQHHVVPTPSQMAELREP